MTDFQLNNSQYNEVSEASLENNSDDENIFRIATNDGPIEPEFKVFDIAREASELRYRHRSLRRSSSIL